MARVSPRQPRGCPGASRDGRGDVGTSHALPCLPWRRCRDLSCEAAGRPWGRRGIAPARLRGCRGTPYGVLAWPWGCRGTSCLAPAAGGGPGVSLAKPHATPQLWWQCRQRSAARSQPGVVRQPDPGASPPQPGGFDHPDLEDASKAARQEAAPAALGSAGRAAGRGASRRVTGPLAYQACPERAEHPGSCLLRSRPPEERPRAGSRYSSPAPTGPSSPYYPGGAKILPAQRHRAWDARHGDGTRGAFTGVKQDLGGIPVLAAAGTAG